MAIYPSTLETKRAFQEMLHQQGADRPTVAMTDITSRNIQIIWNSIQTLATTWRGARDIHVPGMPINRKEFWGAFAKDHEPSCLPVVQEFVRLTPGEGKIALDLGCGNSPVTPLLLSGGWKVIAVDTSRPALEVLAKQHREAIARGLLTIVESDVSDFVPTEPVDLVVAADIFPYINPSRFQETWNKIHARCIKSGGFFIGNLFRDVVSHSEEINLMKEMGAWFLWDRRMVRPLLTTTGYTIQKCIYRQDFPGEEQPCIQFIAQK